MEVLQGGGVPVCEGDGVKVGGGMVAAAPMERCQEVHRLNEFVEGALSADFIHLVRRGDLLTDLCCCTPTVSQAPLVKRICAHASNAHQSFCKESSDQRRLDSS